MELEERTEASESIIKFKSVELSDIFETVDVLTKVVSEQNEVILELEGKVKESKPKDERNNTKERESRIKESNETSFNCGHCQYNTPDRQTYRLHRVNKHTDIAVMAGEAKIYEKNWGNSCLWVPCEWQTGVETI